MNQDTEKKDGRRNWVFWSIVLLFAAIMMLAYQVSQASDPLSLSDLADKVRADDVARIEISADESRALVSLRSDMQGDVATQRYLVRKERGTDTLLAQTGLSADELGRVEYKIAKSSGFTGLAPLLSTIVPFLLMIGFLVFMMRQAQSGNSQAMAFGRSKARMLTGDTPTVTFEDVAGVEEAKQELGEVVEFLREPEKFIALGARIPKGVLMVGPPGCGKTLMARAVAGEAGVPFFTISGSEFVEMFVGVGASRVRDLFDQAKKHSPCIVFVDEIDAVGRQRGAGLGGSHDEREQTLNQILVEMDGFDTDTNVIVIAATNRPDILDPALLRPGRFDRRVVVDRPDMAGRRAILGIHTRGKPIAADVDLDHMAKKTPGFSGADLENMVNEGAILAARRNGRTITAEDLNQAVDKVRLGPERRSRVIAEKELELVAYHEAGHALVSHYVGSADPIDKITIVPRGMANGLVSYLPEDRYLHSRSHLCALMARALGGRIAEELIYGEFSNGATSDLDFVTRTAREMVTRYGMSDSIGPITFGQKNELVFLGRELSDQRNYSEASAHQIDMEVRRLVGESYDRARQLLSDNIDKLHKVAKTLLEVETLDRVAFEALVS